MVRTIYKLGAYKLDVYINNSSETTVEETDLF